MDWKKLEEKVAARKEKIEKYTEAIKKERKLLKQDEKRLAHLKYEEVLKKLMENDVSPDDILEKVDEVIVEEDEDNSEIGETHERSETNEM